MVILPPTHPPENEPHPDYGPERFKRDVLEQKFLKLLEKLG